MSLGIFDARLGWWWESPNHATIELPNLAQIEVKFYPHGDDEGVAQQLGYVGDDARLAANMDFSVPGDTSFATMTRHGRAASLVNTVAFITRQWLRRVEPPLLSFHAETKRARVYEAVAQRIDVPGYRLYRWGNPEGVYGAEYGILREPIPNDAPLRDAHVVRLK